MTSIRIWIESISGAFVAVEILITKLKKSKDFSKKVEKAEKRRKKVEKRQKKRKVQRYKGTKAQRIRQK